MQKFITILFLGLLLSGCAWVHRMDIEQGNIYSSDMVCQLHPGMTMAQVKDIMGSPVLLNTFNENRMDYVYTFQPGNGRMYEKYITLIFSCNRLKEIHEYPPCPH